MRVSEVTLTHNGNKESVNFTEDQNLEVIDRKKMFLFKRDYSKYLCEPLTFLRSKKQTNKQTKKKPITLLIFIKLSYLFLYYHPW